MPLNSRINATLHNVVNKAGSKGAPRQLSNALEYALFPGGARVRPQICLSVAHACGDDQPGLTSAASAAIELIHCASLVHDDMPCFDNADTRRGKPSVHKAFGQPIALLTGDTLIVLAFETIADAAHLDPKRASELTGLLARYTGSPYGICAGQAWESEDEIDLRAYHQAKTGALFIAATQMGAVAAGSDPEPWYELGSRIGEAFQVADDLRDVLYDEETLGKPVGQDEVNNRPNAVTHLGVKGAITHLNNVLSGAISSIPSCPGEAQLCAIVRAQAERLSPMLPQTTPAE